MSKSNITIGREYDRMDKVCVAVEKKRGKLTLCEIEDTIRNADYGQYRGNYVILVLCGEATLEGDGYYDEEPTGDTVILYPAGEGDGCPVCSNMIPPYEYCPECGTAWSDEGKEAARRATVENWLRAIREEAEHRVSTGGLSAVSWHALYWQYVGAVKMARELNLIDNDTLSKLLAEGEKIKPRGGDGMTDIEKAGRIAERLRAMTSERIELTAEEVLRKCQPECCPISLDTFYRWIVGGGNR